MMVIIPIITYCLTFVLRHVLKLGDRGYSHTAFLFYVSSCLSNFKDKISEYGYKISEYGYKIFREMKI